MGLFCDLDAAHREGNSRFSRKRHFYLAQLADDLFRCVFPASHISPFSDSKTLTLELDRFSGGRSGARFTILQSTLTVRFPGAQEGLRDDRFFACRWS